MAHAQKPDFVFRRNGRVHLNRRGRQFSRLLAAEVCASAVVVLDTPRSEVVWRVVATHSFRQFPLHLPSRASPCAIRFQTHATTAVFVKFVSQGVGTVPTGSIKMSFCHPRRTWPPVRFDGQVHIVALTEKWSCVGQVGLAWSDGDVSDKHELGTIIKVERDLTRV
jgi:hypothetical protein